MKKINYSDHDFTLPKIKVGIYLNSYSKQIEKIDKWTSKQTEKKIKV